MNIHEIVRKMENSYVNETVKLGKYVDFSMYETLETIFAYINSKHISGSKDSLGRDKPFDDIITTAVNTRERATDIDTSQIRFIAPNQKAVIQTLFFDVKVKDWMRKARFGQFLNKWGRELAIYNSSLVKSVVKDGELKIETVPWSRVICDPININKAPIIEKLYLTEGEINSMGYDKDVVESLCETRRQLLNKNVVDNNPEYYEVYEVHGYFEDSMLQDEDDTEENEVETFSHQVHIVSFLVDEKGEKTDFTLYKGKEEKSPYILTHLIPEDGRTLSRGVVEQLFDAQWMVNHYSLSLKNQIDHATKIVYQTSDKSFSGKNALSEFETGDILVTSEGNPVTQLNNQAYNGSSTQAIKQDWKNSGREVSFVSDGMLGDVKAGAAWRQTEALLQESHSIFEKMIENKTLYLEEIFREFILPYIKTQLNTTEEISTVLDSNSIDKIDALFLNRKAVQIANKKAAEQFLANADKTSLDEMQAMEKPNVEGTKQELQQSLSELGNQRFFKPSDISEKTWKELFKDYEEQIIIDIAGESVNTAQNVQTLTTALQTIAGNPMLLQDKNAKLILSEILRQTSGISPLQLSETTQAQTAQAGQATQQAPTQIPNPVTSS